MASSRGLHNQSLPFIAAESESMTEQLFSLIPFPKVNIPSIQINGQVNRQNGRLNIQYVLTGEAEKVSLPEKSVSPRRRDGLWASTCFEFFLAVPGRPQYWEFNISPSGDWNVYYMDTYRRVGFREETSINALPSEIQKYAGGVTLNVDVDLNPLISGIDQVQLGISCVIQSIDRHESYWALSHPRPTPDFHLRDSFILQL